MPAPDSSERVTGCSLCRWPASAIWAAAFPVNKRRLSVRPPLVRLARTESDGVCLHRSRVWWRRVEIHAGPMFSDKKQELVSSLSVGQSVAPICLYPRN
jgi:hypothetical protein